MRMSWTGPQVSAAVTKAGTAGLYETAELILVESTKLVPVDTHELELSGEASYDDGAGVAIVSYGYAGAQAYAVRQHEDMGMRHQTGRMAKFLEIPAMRLGASMTAWKIRDAIRRVTGYKGG